MDIEAISGAATVALASTLVFLLVAKSWQVLSRAVGTNTPFANSIMREAAQRFRDEFERLTSSQSTYLSAGLVFVVLYSAAYVLNAERLFVDYPVWQLYMVLAVLVAAASVCSADLLNADLENNTSDPFGSIDHWGPSGGWADHAGFAKPNNETCRALG